jgi:GT2 family glycosyltransferase
LLVIDNGSPDGGGGILSTKVPKTEFFQLKKNLGYAGGNNEGIRKALQEAADYVFIVNPDVRLKPDSIQSYVDVMEADKTIGALNPLQLSEDGKTIDDKFKTYVLREHWKQGCVVPRVNDKHLEVNTLFGAALMLPRCILEKVGGFDPLYFAYGEEQDLCRRIKYNGFRLIVTGKSPVIHLRSHEQDGFQDSRLFLRRKGSYLYYLKNPNAKLKILLRGAMHEMIKDIQTNNHRKLLFLKVALWIIMNFQRIRNHRKLEKLGECVYLNL